MSRLFTLIAFCMTLQCINAQDFRCGTIGHLAEGIVPRLLKNKEMIRKGHLKTPTTTTYLPIKFHLIAKDDGSRRISITKVLDQLCEINEDFSDMDIQFFVKGDFNYIDNTIIYENHSSNTNLLDFHKDNQAINIFMLEDVDSDESSRRAYYSFNSDWIVIENQEIGFNRSLTHEMGHFFSLLHPFHGWDLESYDPNVHGIPAPVFSPMGFLTEKTDGSNCEIAGDKLCDTPADYAYKYPWPNCEFTAEILDPLSKLINPDEKLFMNYFTCSNHDYYFTEDQKNVMQVDLQSTNRNYLRSVSPQTTSIINTLPTIISPSAGMIVDGPNSVDLFWIGIPGANQYLIEIDNAPNFSGDDLISIVSKSEFATVSGLNPNKTYYWRIRPFNDYYGCSKPTNFSSFKTSEDFTNSTSSIPSVQTVSFYPNPMVDNDLQISIKSKEPFLGNLVLLNNQGQQIQSWDNFQFQAGNNQLNFTLNQDIPNGIYFFKINSKQGYILEKIIKSN